MEVKPIYIIPIHGTWGLFDTKAWWKKGSPFNLFCEENNIFYRFNEDDEPFYYSGDVDGIDWRAILTLGLYKDKHTDWLAGSLSFRNYVRNIPLEHRNVIIHSHGLQVIAYSGVALNNIITVGSPIRKDMLNQYKLLKSKCRSWKHIYDNKWDRMAFLGQFGDGRWFGSRNCSIDGVDNCRTKGISHSNILRNEKYFKLWQEQKWFDFLREYKDVTT